MTIAKRKNRVLAVDDEPSMIEWLKILLEHEGYEVRTAMIGTRGEEIFKTWKPDVVVTDMIYRRTMQLVSDLEVRQIAPLREKVEGILVDVKAVTASVSQQTERVNHAISGTMDRVDETAHRVKGSVHDRINQVLGVARGLRAVVSSVTNNHPRREPAAPAASRL